MNYFAKNKRPMRVDNANGRPVPTVPTTKSRMPKIAKDARQTVEARLPSPAKQAFTTRIHNRSIEFSASRARVGTRSHCYPL
jgi:hypothetical protein